jgi:hypothetical protein
VSAGKLRLISHRRADQLLDQIADEWAFQARWEIENYGADEAGEFWRTGLAAAYLAPLRDITNDKPPRHRRRPRRRRRAPADSQSAANRQSTPIHDGGNHD